MELEDITKIEDKAGMLAYLEEYLTENRNQLFERVLDKRTQHFTVAMEDVYKERNSGAIIRTCDCFGIQHLHVIEDSYNHKVAHSISKGAEKWVDVTIHRKDEGSTQACIDTLKNEGYQIIATTPHNNDVLLPEFNIQQKSAFFFGSEKTGISQTVIDQADGFMRIPMHGFTESFNISVAVALTLQDLTHRLHKSDVNWRLSEDVRTATKLEWTIKTIASGFQLADYYLDKIASK